MNQTLRKRLARILDVGEALPWQFQSSSRQTYCPVPITLDRQVIGMVHPGQVIYGLTITTFQRKPRSPSLLLRK